MVCFVFVTTCDELSTEVNILDLPSYYTNEYLDSRVKVINDAIKQCTGECETFFWITDMHWEPDLNTRYSPALIKYIAGKTRIDKVLNGGDTGNSNIICKNAIDRLKKAIGSNRVYTVTGNHEINDASRYEKPFQRVATTLRGHCSDIMYGDGDRSYFYFENKLGKIRYIGLSSYRLFLNNDYESGYTDEQLSWLKYTALNVEAGWTIIIFTHTLYAATTPGDKLSVGLIGADKFIEVIDNYRGMGKIACVLMGHSHKDRIYIGSSGVPYIISACDRQQSYRGEQNVDRTIGTIHEQHFEVVVIDKAAKKINLFSIGANARDGINNTPGQEVDVRTVNY